NVSMLLVGGAVAVVLYYISPFLIPVLFGHEYLPSVSLLSILCISIPLRFLSSNLGAVLVVKENMRNKVLAMGGVACIFVVMTIILVPVYSVYGIVFSVIVCELLLVVLYYIMASKFMRGL